MDWISWGTIRTREEPKDKSFKQGSIRGVEEEIKESDVQGKEEKGCVSIIVI